jgi:hypothetical protein
MIVIGADWDPRAVQTADWLVRRHGVEIAGYGVEAMRRGTERLMNVVATYPTGAASEPEFVADVETEASVPPPPPMMPATIPAPPAG